MARGRGSCWCTCRWGGSGCASADVAGGHGGGPGGGDRGGIHEGDAAAAP